ncbi:MAG: glutathione S-transferase family protein [Pseudomonadota bacterium]
MTLSSDSFSRLVSQARHDVVPIERRTLITPASPLPSTPAEEILSPRFELYHSGMSICSNKVRMTLAQLGASYLSHDVNIKYPAQENYNAAYVRLRLASEVAQEANLATGYNGGSAVADSGFDALVVPTLVDVKQETVVADSRLICLYLGEAVRADGDSAEDLLPEEEQGNVMTQLDLVDRLPQVALLYGADPDEDRRPAPMRQAMADVHKFKLAALEQAWAPHKGEDSRLDAAFAAKIERERAAKAFVGTPEHMRAVIAETDQLIGGFAALLANSDGPWCLGETMTLADIFWLVSLFRLEWLGYGRLWQEQADRQHVTDYAHRGYALESMRTAVIQWPGGYPPSPWVEAWMAPPAKG